MERNAIDRLAQDAEAVRGLRFHHDVQVKIQTPDEIASHLDDELDDEDIEKAKLVYVTLGLLPEAIDLRTLLRGVMGEQVLGFYDTRGHLLVLRDEIAHVLIRSPNSADAAEARVVIVHEFVHALQDQQLELGALAEVERDSDADNALQSLIEGDATLAMIFYAAAQARVSPEEVLDGPLLDRLVQGLSAPAGDDALGQSPAILRYTLVTPYIAGVRFVRELYRDGRWPEVDAAFRTLPASSEQVLHPETYLRGEEPDAIALPAFPALDAVWETVEEDTLGELELSVFLGRGTPDEIDPAAAAGWGGDRLRIYRKPDGTGAAVWFTSWDSEAEAEEAEAAAARDSTQRLVRQGRALLILRGVDADLAPSVLESFAIFAAELPESPPRRPSTIAP